MEEAKLHFTDIIASNVRQLKVLHVATLPVRYAEKFYVDVLSMPPEFNKYGFCNGFVVGAICCRIEEDEATKTKKLYIMTLSILSAYRRRGIGTKLLNYVLENVKNHPELTEIYLHVQTSNESALLFYDSHGFERGEVLLNYYKRIDPPDCYILKKSLVSVPVAPNTDNDT